MFHSSCNSNRKKIKYRCNSNILHYNVFDSMTMSTGVMVIMTVLTLLSRLKNGLVIVDYTISK